MRDSNDISATTDKERFPLLNSIDTPADLRKLPVEKLPEVCQELRECIISHLSSNPGHFASSMGAVEITVALHYVFATPDDRIVWDVGHQAYPHKMLTGRREAFKTQRTLGGLSGFPTPSESEYDTFVAGHAGNSISAALGMAIADRLTPGRENRKTVALIGDASISNGLAFEGLNNASTNPNNLLIVLNDNDMSIDTNVGSLHRYLTNLNTSARYNRLRQRLYQFFRRKGLINDSRKGRMLRFNNSLKALISGSQNIFEGLDIRYFGPFDGHDVVKLVKVLNDIKEMQGPRLLHIRTKKGKGFPEAEKSPTVWHAPGKFNPETGERIKEKSVAEKWQDVFGKKLKEMADKDDRVVGITAAMITGTSMTYMYDSHPDRAFNVGISEGHAVTFAGGLAASGKRPFAAIYSSFLQRAYDNVIHDVAIQGLPVTLCIDRAGFVGEDGVTHHGFFDIVSLRPIPGLEFAVPADARTLRRLMDWSLTRKGPLALRYPRGNAPEHIEGEEIGATLSEENSRESQRPLPRILRKATDSKVAILSVGPIVQEALMAAEMLEKEGIETDIYDMIWVKPLDKELIEMVGKKYDYFVTLEDGAVAGGFGSAIEETLQELGITKPVARVGIGDKWVYHGKVSELRKLCGMDGDGIVGTVKKLMANGDNK